MSARAHYSAGETSYEFKAYKGDDVRQELERLFDRKCAYCETLYVASQPVDVEHYRPKGAVEKTTHPGYWWIAMAWDNLLPSCIDCNRRRRQIDVKLGMTLEEVGRLIAESPATSSGKKDAFPVRTTHCLPEDVQFSTEDPLLIDPTRTDPATHISFVVSDKLSVVVPRLTAAVPDAYGRASIPLYGLNRLGLVQAREVDS
ncbi:MAG: hypothetical protein IPO30_20550 [Hyphomonadaceae bacterium]|nr:hypothetical protein [Hyphomonadaceae bacterium]